MLDRPLVAVIGCNKIFEGEPAQTVKNRYVTAVVEEAGAVPLIVPSLGRAEDAAVIASRVDAVLLTGSSSNVGPSLYGATEVHEPLDRLRDNTVFALIKAARHFSVPVIGICRGLQEINVALGGTLTDTRDTGATPHHCENDEDLEAMFGFVHEVSPAPASLYARFAGPEPKPVISVHYQQVQKLGEGLRVEATSPDGVVEAIASREAEPLVFAVQWHPEWKPKERAHDVAFWRYLGEAARSSARRRAEQGPPLGL